MRIQSPSFLQRSKLGKSMALPQEASDCLTLERLEDRIAPAVFTLGLQSLDGGGFQMKGEALGDQAGQSVSSAGDVNGDGFNDVIVGALTADAGGASSGASYVVFGKASGWAADLELSALDGTNGFKINGQLAGDNFGGSVSSAGDVNGDGFGDLIIGAPNASPNGSLSGEAYVVFGKSTGFSAVLDLSTLDGTNGFKMNGVAAGDALGSSVSAAGDVNGDSFGDIMIGAPGASLNGVSHSGGSYVVFGKNSFSSTLDLTTLDGTNGFRTSGGLTNAYAGHSVASAGDINGDGFHDLLIGGESIKDKGKSTGGAFVVFGAASGFAADINLSTLDGVAGFKIIPEGGSPNTGLRLNVGTGGDLNGDGFDDIIVGASEAKPNGNASGASYVIFGKGTDFGVAVDVLSLDGTNGFKLYGVAANDYSGLSTHFAGDVNGDGFDDLIIGAHGADSNGLVDSGAAYMVLGKASGFSSILQLSSLNGKNGFKITGEAQGDFAGFSVHSAGDVNGDGFDDVIIGAHKADPNGSSSGAAYVVFGTPAQIAAATGKKLTWVDGDGDLVTLSVSKGSLSAGNLKFRADHTLMKLNLSDPEFTGASVKIAVKKALAGDGFVNVGHINAAGVDLKGVKIAGDVGQVDAGDADFLTTALTSLSARSIGALGASTQAAGTVNPLTSSFQGNVGAIKLSTDMSGVISVDGSLKSASIGANLDGSAGGTGAGLISAMGSIGKVTVKGSMIGGADFSGILAGNKLGATKIVGSLTSADVTKPVLISAQGQLGPLKLTDAVAIKSLTVGANVLNARVLAGFDTTLTATNADAGIGKIVVNGNWSASSISAGFADSTNDGFGQNDTKIPGDISPSILSRIASVTIKGLAAGSPVAGQYFGIVAEQIGVISIGGIKQPLTPGADNLSLDLANNNFHAVDQA